MPILRRLPLWCAALALVSCNQTGTTDPAALSGPAFKPEIRFFGPAVSPAVNAAFANAVARIGTVVTGDLPDYALNGFDVARQCDEAGGPTVTETVDDVLIFVTVKPIDGPGKILGSSGPCLIRNANQGRLPIVGTMVFDSADLQGLVDDGRLSDIVLHEMMHVLGFGTLWDPQFKNLVVNKGTATVAYTGAQGVQGCLAITAVTSRCQPTIPVENTGGPGTVDTHWRETVFRNELMTGFAAPAGSAMPLSRMTIQSLADLGYTVDPAAADAFHLRDVLSPVDPLTGRRATVVMGPTEPQELVRRPRLEVGADGRIVPIIH